MTNQGPKVEEPLRSFTETVTVAGNQLLKRVEELIAEGNVRRLIIKNQEGRTLLEVPLTLGAVGVVTAAAFLPALAAIGAVAALVAKVNIIIERYEDPADAAKEQPHIIEVTPTDKPAGQ